jgi:uncharacterized repeat protein (TIGR01451 family)
MRHSILKISICTIIAFFSLFILTTEKAYSLGTIYNAVITNRATVSGDNLANSISVTNTTNVMRIIGGSWSGGADVGSSSAGSVETLTTYFTNVGNADNVIWRFGVFDTNYNTATLAEPWTWVLLTNTVTALSQANGYTNTSAFNFLMDIGDSVRIDFRVYVALGAVTGTAGWNLIAVNTTGGQNTLSYISDDGTTRFGGAPTIGFGENVAGRVDLYSGANYYYEITISAPNITITKDISQIVTGSGNAPDNIAIPGATITYRIAVTNSGAGATRLVVTDVFDLAYVSFVAASQTDMETSGANTYNASQAGNTVKWSNTGIFDQGERSVFTYQVVIR